MAAHRAGRWRGALHARLPPVLPCDRSVRLSPGRRAARPGGLASGIESARGGHRLRHPCDPHVRPAQPDGPFLRRRRARGHCRGRREARPPRDQRRDLERSRVLRCDAHPVRVAVARCCGSNSDHRCRQQVVQPRGHALRGRPHRARGSGGQDRRASGSRARRRWVAGRGGHARGVELGDEWLAETLALLERHRDHLAARLATELPEVGFTSPEATYLAWLDFSALGLGDDPAAVCSSARKSRCPQGSTSARRAPGSLGSTSRLTQMCSTRSWIGLWPQFGRRNTWVEL